MTERILDIGSVPARLTVGHEQLVIARAGEPDASVPLDDIAAVVLSSPAVTLSAGVLAGLAKRSVCLVVSGPDHMPVGMVLPLTGNLLQSERHARQATLRAPARKRLWQTIIRSKIQNQAAVLMALTGSDSGLLALAARVRSGDPENMEAQAARRYWPLLFGDPSFRRGGDPPGANAWLNYGYAVLRAGTARALCAAGLHPSLGLQHHSRYDPFCLASDVMEPFRPLVDLAVAVIGAANPGRLALPLDPEAKAALLQFWPQRYVANGEHRCLADILGHTASALAAAISDRCPFHLIQIQIEPPAASTAPKLPPAREEEPWHQAQSAGA